MVETLRRIAESPGFQRSITAVILVAGAIAGLETYPQIVARYHSVLEIANWLVLAVFVAEIVVKMGAEGARPWQYFRDPWNAFDFVIVLVCVLPIEAEGVAVLRLARLLRVLKLVRALPRLQLLVSALLKSIPSMGYVTLLLGLLFYLYAVAATHLFGENDPVYFGNLESSLLSLFRIVTLEGWTELLYIQMYGCDAFGYDNWPGQCVAPSAAPLTAVTFFVSFILIGTMVVMNLFVGVIMKGMEEAHDEQEKELVAAQQAGATSLDVELDALRSRLASLNEQLERVHALARSRGSVAAK